MALTQEQVDWWFSQNPNATAEDVAAAVKAAGGLEANEGLAGMIANRYSIAEPEVTNYYNAYTAPTTTPAVTTPANTQTFTDTITAGTPTTQEELLAALGTTPAVTTPELIPTKADTTGLPPTKTTQIDETGTLVPLGDGTYRTWNGDIIDANGYPVVTTSTLADTITSNNGATTGATTGNWPSIIYGTTGTEGDVLTRTTTSDGTPFYLRGEEGGEYQNPNTVESYAPFTGADGKTYYHVYAPTFSSGKAWNETPITGTLTEAQYKALRGGTTLGDAVTSIINSPVGSFGLGLLGPYGQIINAANQANQGNILGAITSGLGAAQGFGVTDLGGFAIKDIQNVARGLNAIDKKDLMGALTAGANLVGGVPGDYKTVTNLASATLALKNNDTAGFLSAVGDLTGSADAKTAAAASRLLTAISADTPNLAAIQAAATGLNTAVNKTGSTTGTTDTTTVGNFEDTEVTRLKGLGYTNKQIQDYFNNLDNLTSVLDTTNSTITGAAGNDVTLPAGTQLASVGSGFDVGTVSGAPIFAESANASSITVPFGYRLTSASETDDKPAGSFYDPTTNAWFSPNTAVTNLTGSDTIKTDAALFNNSLGTLDQLDANRTADDFADFLKTIGITNVTQLTDSGLSNQDILDMINALDDTVTVTGGKGNDTITGGTGNDNLETVTVTGGKGNDTVTGIDTITGGIGNDIGKLGCPAGKVPNADGTACIDEVIIKGGRDPCPAGTVYDEDLDQCVPLEQDPCPTGYHRDASGQCVQDECPEGYVRNLGTGACEKVEDDCPTGYERDEITGQCIPVIEIKDKKCDPGFVYDEDLKMCVAVEEEPCDTGYHRENGVCVPDECPEGYVRNLATGACEKVEEPCPEGYSRDELTGKCIPDILIKDKKCDPGYVYDEDLKQCVPIKKDDPCAEGFHLENGICVPNDDGKCETGYEKVNGACVPVCADGYVRNLATGVCEKAEEPCPTGYERDEITGKCIPVIEIKDKKCDPGFVYDEDLKQCVPITTECAPGFHDDGTGLCVPDDEECKDGFEKIGGECVPVCKEGYIRNLATGVCEKPEDKGCPPGQVKDANGKCVPITKPPVECQPGYEKVNGVCVPVCKPGYKRVDGVCKKIATDVVPSTSVYGGEGEKIDPIYAGGMDDFDLFATLEELLADKPDKTDKKKDNKNSKDKTKMATGGHLDDLLAEQMTVDDLLKLLR